MMLERIDTRINMSDHFTKGLSRALFHQHADYSLGHIPPVYLPIYKSTIGTYTDQPVNLGKNVKTLFIPISCVHILSPGPNTDGNC